MQCSFCMSVCISFVICQFILFFSLNTMCYSAKVRVFSLIMNDVWNKMFVSCYLKMWATYLPTYPGVPQAVDITLPEPSILDSPKSLIMILESSSML